jgi:Predicted amidohydrolase
MNVSANKIENVSKAIEMIEQASEKGADIVVLPEMFNCPYNSSKFSEYSEVICDSITIKSISEIAQKLGIYIVAGSIPEGEESRIYNTCVIFDRKGKIIGRHRKMHLFDIDVEGKIRFMESEVLSSGNEVTVVDTEFCKIGIAICYDIRFPELSRLMALEGAEVIIIPGAFNMVTGPAHWELLIRTRALDNQVYLAAASPSRDIDSTYIAYGNSMVASPWGDIVARAGVDEEIIIADVDLAEICRIRRELPLLKHMRTDLYNLSSLRKNDYKK